MSFYFASALLLVCLCMCYGDNLNPEDDTSNYQNDAIPDAIRQVKSYLTGWNKFSPMAQYSMSQASASATAASFSDPSGASGSRASASSYSNSVNYQGRVCTSEPKAIANAETRCQSAQTCMAQCLNGYQFPNGDKKMRINCEAGEWALERFEWSDKLACEPICMPACQNNGICMKPGVCSCPENFVGPFCEQEKKLCLTRPNVPRNSKLACSSTICTVTCAKGYIFPDGSSITNIFCKEGAWKPARVEQTTVPDCQPTCTPICQNNGTCISYNVCQCDKEHRGKQCQYRLDACSPKKLNFNGSYNCTGDNEFLRCKLRCPDNINFLSPPANEYVCEFANGVFTPAVVPQCNYTADMQVIHGPESFRSVNLVNQTSIHSGNATGRRKVKKIRKKGYNAYSVDGDEDDDESYEEIITKTKITVKKRRKSKKSRGQHKPGDEDEEYEEYEDADSEASNQLHAIGVESLYLSSDLTITHRVPKPATCITWNGNKIKTFDGLVFNANMRCSHTLVKDRSDGTFSIVLRACANNIVEPCPHSIEIMMSNTKYIIENLNDSVVVFKEDKQMPIPIQIMGLRITKVGLTYKIALELLGLTIIWDGQRMVTIEASAALFNRTDGLCGTNDQNTANDFMSKDGTVHKTPSIFVDAWKVSNTDCDKDMLGDDPSIRFTCADDIKQKGSQICDVLLNNTKFDGCLKTIKREAVLNACILDYCHCNQENRQQCVCNGMAVFARECQFQGIDLKQDWRDMNLCPLQCPGGRVYRSCGPAFEQSCGSASENVITSMDCNEGCFCPDGKIQNNGECIRVEECPCVLRGKTFAAGSEIKKDCNTCKCQNGQWKCTDETCGARCGAIGDPHYLTFDGKHFDFMGKCSYYLLQTDGISIEASNVPCDGSISQAMNLAVGVDLPSCTKSVTLRVTHSNQTSTIELKQGRQVVVDGYELTRLPITLFDGLLRIRFASSTMILVAFRDGIKVWWDGMTRVYIDAPPAYRGRTKGLCGTFNSNQQDDFLTPEGDIESNVGSFANKWRTKESCDYVNDGVNIPHPCQSNMENKEKALQVCGKLKSQIFEQCHWFVDPEMFYEDCMYDMCACKGETASCMCPIFSAYANECSQKGSIIHWRRSIHECAITCPAGQVFEECSDKCYRSCADIDSTPSTCHTKCVEGCRCPEGEALDDNNECIPIGLCPCSYKGLTFNSGYKEVRPGTKHLDLCTCSGAQWKCVEATEVDKDKYPPAEDLRNQCMADKNEEFSTCIPAEPKTCKNMNAYSSKLAIECRPGCVCKKGFVLDVELNKCVKPNDCSCHHGHKSFSDGEHIKSDCNTCVCNSGTWNCTTRICPATCTAYGDSHFTTYDGKNFDFQGACSYVLSKGSIENDGFTVTIQNVLCGTHGVTCSKSVTITLNGKEIESITLSSDATVPGSLVSRSQVNEVVRHGKPNALTVHRAGVFVVIEASGMGIQLKWDRKTRIYVQLTSRWKGRVQGLCGDFDGNAMNDFKSPSTGLESNAVLFGDSWKLEDFCAKPIDQIDACNTHPERKIWAEKKCGILKSEVFADCHSEVPVDAFLKRCEFDSCACDTGGDCECLCTAIAAYEHACSMKGVPIRWRTPDLCPMQCDHHCSEYSSCVPPCAVETCDNMLQQGRDQQLCNADTCVEGCLIKPCPIGEIYTNDSYTECVPKTVCRPVCLQLNGIEYYEGDVTRSDKCQTCHCSKGKEICSGVPCPPEPVPVPTVIYNQDESQSCRSGWGGWINQDMANAKQTKKLDDREPLPTAFMLKNYNGSAFCSADFMRQIECRTVGDHLHPKETGEDVECSLEKGLICVGECHDYETRVLCDCNEDVEVFTLPSIDTHTAPHVREPMIEATTKPSTLYGSICNPAIPHVEKPGNCHEFYHCTMNISGVWTFVEKTCGDSMMFNPQAMVCDHIDNVKRMKPGCGKLVIVNDVIEKVEPKCASGKVWSDCAIPCGRSCHFYKQLLYKNSLCRSSSDPCIPGCVPVKTPVQCPPNHYWRDTMACVKLADCTCRSDNGVMVKPGAVYKESDCKVCQCIDNAYVCDTQACKRDRQLDLTKETNEVIYKEDKKDVISGDVTTVPVTIINTATPPIHCEPDNLVPLINGTSPLPDSAFNASSSLSISSRPQFARLNAKAIGSRGSWSPKDDTQAQYIQISFDRATPIYGAIMQGSPLLSQYVTSYKILYSVDGQTFHNVVDETNQPQLFSGSIDPKTPVKSMFKIPIEAKVIRFYPVTWSGAIAMRVELLGCSLQKTPTVTPIPPVHHDEHEEKPICDEPFGVESGLLHDDQIILSSFKSQIAEVIAKQALKLSSDLGWQPNLDSPNEFVIFDFKQLRNVTGIRLKGGQHGWVKSYKILYSNDLIAWNKLLSADGMNEQTFLANFDATTAKTNYFRLPIQTRAIKIIPLTWTSCIEMKIEPIGCFIPYEYTPPTPLPPLPINVTCDICPGIAADSGMIEGVCKCRSGQFWNGVECVARNMCPCIVDGLTYGVGAQFESNDCAQCTCVLGGNLQCKPRDCQPCGKGLRRVVSASCLCRCEPCPANEILCQTSGTCIPEAKWCDGVQDCADDELNCAYKSQSSRKTIETIKEKIIVTETCSKPKCPPGYIVKLHKSTKAKTSPMLNNDNAPSANDVNEILKTTNGSRADKLDSKLPRPNKKRGDKMLAPLNECPEYDCVPEKPAVAIGIEELKCPQPTCPGGYEIVFDTKPLSTACAKYRCELIPQKDVVCNVTGSTFSTFDGVEFKYDVCDHILARDLLANNWTISLQKDCSQGDFVCKTLITIVDKSCNLVIILRTDLTVSLDGYAYTIDQVQQSVYNQMKLFTVSQLGDSILFVSQLQGFWVRLNVAGDVKVGVSSKYRASMDGLCGYYNDYANDDKRLPNGTIVMSTFDFGNSWLRDQRSANKCLPNACSAIQQEQAWSLCNTIKDEAFASCSKAVNPDQFIQKCLENACNCLKSKSFNDQGQCKCSILQNYVTECMTNDDTLEIDTWRTKFECPVSCPPTLVHRDCYRRRCELTCDATNNKNCLHLPGTCFPGCYCAEGYVRHGGKCIPTSECRDCVCDGFSRSQYLTYDRRNFTFDSNCTYLLSRDIGILNAYAFQVYVTLGSCGASNGNRRSCATGLYVLSDGHAVHLVNNDDTITVDIDGKMLDTLPFQNDWIRFTEQHGIGLTLELTKSAVDVSVLYAGFEFSIKIPSFKYGGKVEGLCGNCNGNANDDLQPNPKHANKVNSTDLKDTLQTWLADEPALNLTEKCITEAETIQQCARPPSGQDPCLQMLDASIFGQCHLIVDPRQFVSMCQIDMCKIGQDPKANCAHLAAYARECSRRGICIDWKRGVCHEQFECASDMEYKACGCHRPCDMLDLLDVRGAFVDQQLGTCTEPIEGCFCKDGKRLNSAGKCVTEQQCKPCDNDGHYMGDKWQRDQCTDCECSVNGTVECKHKVCPTKEQIICQLGFTKHTVPPKANECCPTYQCVPEIVRVTCVEKPKPICSPDQYTKMIVDANNCTSLICECVPLKECKLVSNRPLLAGEKLVRETAGCCPREKIVCDKTLCPSRPTRCDEEFFKVAVKPTTNPALCCDEFICVPPKDVCIVEDGQRKTTKAINEQWLSSDICVKKKCVYGVNGIPIISEERETCSVTSCPLGYKMTTPTDRCCGKCVPDKCIVANTTYAIGSTWYSQDNCTTFTCTLIGEQLSVSTSKATCPDVSDCPAEQRYFADCCQRCRPKAEDKSQCLAISLNEPQTIGLIEKVQKPHGKCINIEPIRGFTECQGACNSGTKFNRLTFTHEKKCKCCSISNYVELKVSVKCDDGTKQTIPVSVPKTCSCQPCDGDKLGHELYEVVAQ